MTKLSLRIFNLLTMWHMQVRNLIKRTEPEFQSVESTPPASGEPPSSIGLPLTPQRGDDYQFTYREALKEKTYRLT